MGQCVVCRGGFRLWFLDAHTYALEHGTGSGGAEVAGRIGTTGLHNPRLHL